MSLAPRTTITEPPSPPPDTIKNQALKLIVQLIGKERMTEALQNHEGDKDFLDTLVQMHQVLANPGLASYILCSIEFALLCLSVPPVANPCNLHTHKGTLPFHLCTLPLL